MVYQTPYIPGWYTRPPYIPGWCINREVLTRVVYKPGGINPGGIPQCTYPGGIPQCTHTRVVYNGVDNPGGV